MKIPKPVGLMRRRDAAEFLSISVGTLRRRERDDPTFPKPVVISERSICYRTSELLAWVAARPTAVVNQAVTAAASAALAAKRARQLEHQIHDDGPSRLAQRQHGKGP